MLSWQPLLFFFSFPYLLDSMAFMVARGAGWAISSQPECRMFVAPNTR